MHEAATMGNIEMLLGLLELNVSVEQVDAQGWGWNRRVFFS